MGGERVYSALSVSRPRTLLDFIVMADDTNANTEGPAPAGGSRGRDGPLVSEENAVSFVGTALLAEGALALLGWGLGVWSGIGWGAMLRVDPGAVGLGMGGGLGLVVLHLLLIFPGGARNPLYRTVYQPLRAALRPPLRAASPTALVLLALASGLGEEVLFRGWLQTEAGITVASLLFGACHVWGREALPYGLYAAGMGFVLGGLFAYSGQNLWAPVLAHAVNNLLGLWALKYDWLPSNPA